MKETKTTQFDMEYFREIMNKHEGISFLDTQVSGFVGMVDITESTKMASKIIPSKITKYYSIFLNSMSSIIREYGGIVVKNLGDCILFYFANENNSEYNCKRIIECSMTMTECSCIIDDLLQKEGLTSIKYRISCDYGNILLAKTATYTDIFGPTVNYCSKINKLASNNGIVIGNDLYSLARKFEEYSCTSVSSFSNTLKQSYGVYSIMRK